MYILLCFLTILKCKQTTISKIQNYSFYHMFAFIYFWNSNYLKPQLTHTFENSLSSSSCYSYRCFMFYLANGFVLSAKLSILTSKYFARISNSLWIQWSRDDLYLNCTHKVTYLEILWRRMFSLLTIFEHKIQSISRPQYGNNSICHSLSLANNSS